MGSDAGNVKRIELRSKQVSGGKVVLWLEHVFTLKRQPKLRRSSTQLRSVASTEMDDLSRADSARASEDSALPEEPAAAVQPGSRAHAGPVTAIQVHRNAVYTSGGSQGAAALHEWTQGGTLHHSHSLKELGKLCCQSSACLVSRESLALLVHRMPEAVKIDFPTLFCQFRQLWSMCHSLRLIAPLWLKVDSMHAWEPPSYLTCGSLMSVWYIFCRRRKGDCHPERSGECQIASRHGSSPQLC